MELLILLILIVAVVVSPVLFKLPQKIDEIAVVLKDWRHRAGK